MDSGLGSINTIVKAQIVFLLSTLTEENFERNQQEIRSLSEQHGLDTYLHFIRRLIVHSQARLTASSSPAAFDTSNSLTYRLLVQETQRLARDPFLAERFREGIDKGEGDIFRNFDLVRFADRVGLRPLERLVLASSVIGASTRKELSSQALVIIRIDFENALTSLCQHPSFDHADLSPSQVAKLLSNLLTEPPSDSPILDTNQRHSLITAAQRKYGHDIISPILQQILPNLSLASGSTILSTLISLGPEITSEMLLVRAVVQRFGMTEVTPPHNDQVEEIMNSIVNHTSDVTSLCDVGALVRALSDLNPLLKWSSVIKMFDRPDRTGVDTATLKMLIAVLLNAPREGEDSAVTGFWTVWSNSIYQLRLLDALLSLPADTFNFVSLPGRRVVTVEDMSTASPTIKALAANVQGHTWNSLDLFEVLVRLGDSDLPEIALLVREMLDKAVKISPELVHMGLLQGPEPWNAVQTDYCAKLLSMFLAGHPNHQLVLMRIWQIMPTYLTDAFRDHYLDNPLNITRILDIAQDLKILEALLAIRPFTLALDVAALASRREYLNLDKWLSDKVTDHGREFLVAVMDFLDNKMTVEKTSRLSEPPVESRTMFLSAPTIAIFLRIIRNQSSLLTDEDLDRFRDVKMACIQINPRLMTLKPGSDQEPGFAVVNYTPDIETEVDAIFKQMYDESITIDHVVSSLQKRRASANTREQEMFACMIHFLFDEYKFFQSFYPARELAMTGYLFGSIIQHQLLDQFPLGMAFRYVVDALRCPTETNLFKFGVQALMRFESKLYIWKPLCNALLDMPHLLEDQPALADVIRKALAFSGDSEPPHETVESYLGISGLPDTTVSSFSSIQADSMPDTDLETPPEEVSDKILFIVNNLAPSNFDSKIEDMRERFEDRFARWFSHYLVDQRISAEPNNHTLYLRFLDALDRRQVMRHVINETLMKASQLLNSEKTVQLSTERVVLKNLGAWLGSITLARDKPILHRNVSFKDLLIEGYDSNRLIVTIPFVCKILEASSRSKVFKPPNPWLMSVISLLAELYHFAELKLNLKFEIEVLCKTLNIDLDELEVTSVLRNRPLAETLAGPPLPDYVPDIDALPMSGYGPSTTTSATDAPVLGLGAAGAPSGVHRDIDPRIESIINEVMNAVYVSPQLSPMNNNVTFKRAVALAVSQTLRESVFPVVERSVTIAAISTRELVSKDYATDGNEGKLRKAAYYMAQNLASSLAMVTCKDPLKAHMPGNIRNSLKDHGFGEAISEQVIALLVTDNMDIACSAVEKAAQERAISEVDESLAEAYEARRRHRESGISQPYWELNPAQTAFTSSLPDPLRLKMNGVQQTQGRVYDDFALDRRPPIHRTSTASGFARTDNFSVYDRIPTPSEPSESRTAVIPHDDAMDRFTNLMLSMEALLNQVAPHTKTVPSNHDIRLYMRQILVIAVQCQEPRRTPLVMSQKVVQALYKTPSQLGREVFVTILDQLCRGFDDVAKEAIGWLIYADDERKLNVPVTVTLLRSGLINVRQLDQSLAKALLDDVRPSLAQYIIHLVRECVASDPQVASPQEFLHCTRALKETAGSTRSVDSVRQLFEDLYTGQRSAQLGLGVTGTPALRPSNVSEAPEKLVLLFHQWVSIYQRFQNLEKSFVPFITQVTKQGILKAEDVSSLFYRVCTEQSVEHYTKCMTIGEYGSAFQALDALARLIVYLIKYHGDASSANNEPANIHAKVHYLTKILSIVVLVLASMHEENGPAFKQKPFFRFFSSLLSDMHALEATFDQAYFHLLVAVGDTLSSLQPVYFPGFSFSWMALISHRLFMPKLLLSENREGWATFHKLLVALFKFLAPILRSAEMQDTSRDLYRGTLRLLLVLLHDFPEFLSEYYFTLCDAIPARCIQLRNIILCAFPTSLTLPDPYLHGSKLDGHPEMGPIPPILSDFTSGLKSGDLRLHLDQYLLNRGSPSFLTTLKDRLHIKASEQQSDQYNLTLLNCLVMYVGVSSVAQTKARSGSSSFISSDPGVMVLRYLATDLDAEGQYHLIGAMVLHLRFPNAHTQWFASLILHLFAEIRDERFREIVTRVLLERFIVHRPHPWGALVTFIELLRNPKYEFASCAFTQAVPEVTLLLESVARSVLQH